MAFIAPIAAAVSAISGAVSTFKGLKQAKEKPPEQKALPPPPTPEGAKTTAAEQVKRRRLSMLSGNTDITKGSAILQSGQVAQKTLVGQ